MKIVLFLLLIMFYGNLFSQKDTVIINGFKFYAVTLTVKNDFGSKDTLMKFYRIDNGKPKYLLTHYLYRFSADCNNEFTDAGNYAVKHDSIIFVTNYLQKTGNDPIPDTRMQIYKIQTNGKLLEIYDKELQRYTGEWLDTQK
ncbi:MAG: hypothetical protein ACXVPY_12825 [Bacteroidia bacterium]